LVQERKNIVVFLVFIDKIAADDDERYKKNVTFKLTRSFPEFKSIHFLLTDPSRLRSGVVYQL